MPIYIYNSTLTKNRGSALMSLDGSTFYIYNSILSENSATNGGAINGNAFIYNSILTRNNATNGGAICNQRNLFIFNSTLTENNATNGGAIYNNNTGNLSVTSSNIINNSAVNQGSAIYNEGGLGIVNFNRIINNNPNFAIYGSGIEARNNWWGSNSNPAGKVYGFVDVSVWLVLTSIPNTNISKDGNCIITVDLQHDNCGNYHNPTDGHVPDGILVNSATNFGNVNRLSMINGVTQITLKFGNVIRTVDVSSKVDNETVHSIININNPILIAWTNIKSGLYNVNKQVSLYMNKEGNIYYTLNGATPTKSSTKYTKPITITSSATLKFIAIDDAGNPSPVYTATYKIDKTAPKVISSYPKRYATKASRISTMYIKFSEKLKAGVNWSKIVVKNKYGKAVSIRKWIYNNVLYIKTRTKRSRYSYYTIYIPYSAIKDYSGNYFASRYTIKFKTGR